MHFFSSGLLDARGPHLFFNGMALLWMGSAAVSALPAPGEKSSPTYQWLFRFLHLLAANLDRAGLLPTPPADVLGNARPTDSL